MSNRLPSMAFELPFTWTEKVDALFDEQVKAVEAQILALRWERFLHRLDQAWGPDIHMVRFRHLSTFNAIALDVEMRMPDWFLPVQPDGTIEGTKPMDDPNSFRVSMYEQRVVLPFRKTVSLAVQAEGLPEALILEGLNCSSASPFRTKEQFMALGREMVDRIAGPQRLQAHLGASLESAPSQKGPRF